MRYLVHTSHSQLGALPLGCIGWTLTLTALGLIQWRVWYVDDLEYITSGVVWVGVWRACFNSHTLVSPEFRAMFCRSIRLDDDYTPLAVKAAQVLMLASAVLGLLGNACAVYALRNVHLGLDKSTPIRAAFSTAGVLLLLAAVTSLTPLGWNVYAVVNNQTIAFPEDFHMPPAPVSQKVGAGIMVGIIASVLTLTSGVMYLNYRLPKRSGLSLGVQPPPQAEGSLGEPTSSGNGDKTNNQRVTLKSDRGIDNQGFETV